MAKIFSELNLKKYGFGDAMARIQFQMMMLDFRQLNLFQ